MAFAEFVSIALIALLACAFAGAEHVPSKHVRCKSVGNATTTPPFTCVMHPCRAINNGLPCCSAQDKATGTDYDFAAAIDVEPHCVVGTEQQVVDNGVTVHYLTRAFTNFSCLTECYGDQLLSVLNPNARLNYFRCYTFEGGNDDDVSRTSLSPNIVCKTNWSGTGAGIAVITILSIVGFLLLVALAGFAFIRFKQYRNKRSDPSWTRGAAEPNA